MDAVSLAAKYRQDLGGPQGQLFPEEAAYASYRRYCAVVNVLPMDFEQWKSVDRALFSRQGRVKTTSGDE